MWLVKVVSLSWEMKINHWNPWKIEQNRSSEQVRQAHFSHKTNRFMWDRHLSHLLVSPKYVWQVSGIGACRTYKPIGFMWDRRLSHLLPLVLCETNKWDKRLFHLLPLVLCEIGKWDRRMSHLFPLVVCETGTYLSYFSKVITWVTCVRFKRIIYHFEAYDETKQIQNCILHFIHINVLHITLLGFVMWNLISFVFFL